MIRYSKKTDPRTGEEWIETGLRGKELLNIPLLNKGTAFSKTERMELGLIGKLPYRIENLEEQLARVYQQYKCYSSILQKNIYLSTLHDKNEVLFYRLLSDHLEEMMPIIYTPAVGSAVQEYSREYRQPRGLFISYPDRKHMREIFDNRSHPEIALIIVTDGERILGIGDQGVGGIDIPVAKQMVYSLCGLDPYKALPIILDVGTNNKEHLHDPFYLGWRHERVTGQEYDDFIEDFVTIVQEKFPKVFLHWEDFGRDNARRILEKYCDRFCMFNDDMQGTGAVTVAAILAGIRATSIPFTEQRIVVFGAGTAGVGIADQLCLAMAQQGVPLSLARKQFWLIDKDGLITENSKDIQSFQRPYVREFSELVAWKKSASLTFDLQTVVDHVHPTVLIGTSAVRGAFTESIVRSMARFVERPAIFPLSNPTDCCEAKPEHLIAWTEGRALIASGSPFDPVSYSGRNIEIAQCNNALVFPGIGLGVLACGAVRLTDNMLFSAAQTVAQQSPMYHDPYAPLLPKLFSARQLAFQVACAVAKQARKDGVSTAEPNISEEALVQAILWRPVYVPVKRT